MTSSAELLLVKPNQKKSNGTAWVGHEKAVATCLVTPSQTRGGCTGYFGAFYALKTQLLAGLVTLPNPTPEDSPLEKQRPQVPDRAGVAPSFDQGLCPVFCDG